MENLYLRSDGYAETQSGLFATVMQRYTGVTRDGANYHFTVKLCPTCGGTRLEWPVKTHIMLLEQSLVTFLEGKGYSRGLSGEEVDSYNEAVAAYLAAAGEDGGPGAIPDGIEGENEPEGGSEGEGAPSETDPPGADDGAPEAATSDLLSGAPDNPPVATEGEQSEPASSTASEAGTDLTETPPDDASSKKSKKG